MGSLQMVDRTGNLSPSEALEVMHAEASIRSWAADTEYPERSLAAAQVWLANLSGDQFSSWGFRARTV